MKQLEQLNEKIAIKKPEHMLGFKQQSWAKSKDDVQKILDLYDNTGLDPLTPDEFDNLFNDTDTLLYDKITGGSTHLVGAKGNSIEIDKATALNIIAKPKGYKELTEALDSFEQLAQEHYKPSDIFPVSSAYTKRQITDYFCINSKGKLDYTDELKQAITEAGFNYITTKRGKAIHEFCTKVAELYKECGLPEHFPLNNRPEPNKVMPGDIAWLLKEHMQFVDSCTGTYAPLFHKWHDGDFCYKADRNNFVMKKADIE